MPFRKGIPVRGASLTFVSVEPSSFNGERTADRVTGELESVLQATLFDAATAQAEVVELRLPESAVPKVASGAPLEFDELYYRSYVGKNGLFREIWSVSGLRGGGRRGD